MSAQEDKVNFREECEAMVTELFFDDEGKELDARRETEAGTVV